MERGHERFGVEKEGVNMEPEEKKRVTEIRRGGEGGTINVKANEWGGAEDVEWWTVVGGDWRRGVTLEA